MSVRIFSLIFLVIHLSQSLPSGEWICISNEKILDKKIEFFSNTNLRPEQCTVIVEYTNRYQRNRQDVCTVHTLAITSLPPPSFSSNHTMHSFKIHSCQLAKLDDLPFSLPASLELLDLSYNALSTFVLSFPLPFNLNYIRLDYNPNLININFGNNRIQQRLIGISLRGNHRIQLSSLPLHLTHLDLTDCNLSQSILPVSLTKLTHLSLANNQFEQLPSIDEGIDEWQLEYLDLSNNHLTDMEPVWLQRSLQKLNLKFNRIRSLEFFKDKLINQTHDQQTTLRLSLHGNPLICDCWIGALIKASPLSILVTDFDKLECNSRRILAVSQDDFLCPYSRHCTSDCSCCDFEACDCHAICPSGCSCWHDAQWSRHIVNCSRANLTDIQTLLPQTVNELNYEDNHIEQMKSFVFLGKISLIKLNLAKNNLRQLNKNTFCDATNLRQLNLSQNPHLISIGPFIDEIFACLKYLQEIILSKEQINNMDIGWTSVTKDDNKNIIYIIRKKIRPSTSSASTSSSTLLNVLMISSTQPTHKSPISVSSVAPHDCTTFTLPLSTVVRHVPFVQHNQTLVIVVFFLLLFVLLFLILLITLALCRRKLRRHLNAEIHHQRAHHYYYHHTRLHPASTKTIATGAGGTNDSLYEQLPSLSSDSELPFLYTEKKSALINAPALPPHPPTFRHHFCCHTPNRVPHPPSSNSHEYQYATNATTTTGYSTPTSQQHQCAAILVWANRLLYSTNNTDDRRDSCPSDLQHLQQCLLSNPPSTTTDGSILRYCNNETLLVPTSPCQCPGHAQNPTDTYIYPHVYR